jgi:hypothetical protein
VRTLTCRSYASTAQGDVGPRAPSGRRIAFARDGDVYSMRVRTLTPGVGDEYATSWQAVP